MARPHSVGQWAVLGGISAPFGDILQFIPAAPCLKELPIPRGNQVLTGNLEVVSLGSIPPCSQQDPGSHLPSPVPGDPKGAEYLYVQVENALAVQVVQPLHQLLDVDLDLQPRPGLRWEPSSTSSSTSFPAPL